MPGGAELVRAERAARRAQRPAAGGRRAGAQPTVADTGEGSGIIRASWAGTILFVLGTVVAAAVPNARVAVAIIDVALFVAGCAVYFWAFTVAVGRSRDREISLWSLFLLEGVAPPRVRRALLAPPVVQIVVALATAWIAAPLAFGILAPVWSLSCSGLWGAKYGQFGPRRVVPSRWSRPAGGADAST
jgi:uncharacterized membrane protein YhaH (DUF805 family)